MSKIAYGLLAEYQGTTEGPDGDEIPVFQGGLIRLDTERELDVAQALKDGDGQIVVAEDDHAALLVLDNYVALKRLGAPDDDTETATSRYDALTVPKLREELERRDLPSGGRRDELVELLQADDAGQAEPATDDDDTGEVTS